MNFNFPQDYEVNKYMGYDIVSLTLSTFTAQNGLKRNSRPCTAMDSGGSPDLPGNFLK